MTLVESPPPEPLVRLADIPGRGRAFLASRHIKPGEILLSDSPLLLYPAVSAGETSSPYCSHCFRSVRSTPTPCPFCTSVVFCSTRCLSGALSSCHSPSICRALAALPPLPDPELRAQVQFLLAASSLSSTSPANFHHLLSLDGGDATPAQQEAIFLHSLLSPLTGFSLQVTATLIAKDKRNAFGLMEPFRAEDAGERRVRAYGIYPNASFFNHDCLPNACRFDYLDRDGDGNTDIMVRAIHDIPEGREVCLSYFPTNWGYKERQQRLMEDYGFQCICDRCEVEKNWKDEDEEDMEEEEEDERLEEMDEEVVENAGDGNDEFPHAYFFVRYVCDQDNCGGTMAPLPPSPQGTPSGLIECNVCGRLRKEEDGFGGDDDDGDGIMLDQ
ncbi:histone-lysine N-methyltransferase ASHR2 [Dendrobium catenatum]|uniref:Histone-lysine N-methyltransferase ASHR2 n=1 Tax=Dendrobium catenatum TaxID=906689 RepID=A0A2I0VQB2_9ASPA|nr:histone-lysine N-methyltransferase ASHR2 [Dendrobium catenatum]XP_020699825.1 histone-lysine N-methyltransferase ASHR2 [Dendrobium catenatum]PKU65601.1 Histone-lysine N-methyltransferase ASHR2 [Dendrobium catenatum]